MTNNLNKIVLFIFFAISGYYLIVFNMGLSPNDDFNLINSIESLQYYLPYSENNKYYNPIDFGRFTPLTAMEYNLMFFITNIYSFKTIFITHYVQFLIFEILIFALAIRYSISLKILFLINFIIIFSPSFSILFMKTQLNERNVFILSLIISYLFLRISEKPKKNLETFFLCFFSICYLLYKEISFMQLISLGTLTLFLKNKNKNIIFYSIFNIIISIAYLIYYFMFIGSDHISNYSDSNWEFIKFIKVFVHYIFIYDPIIYLIIIPFIFLIFYKKIINNDFLLKNYEVLCLSSLAIIVFYIYKPINSQYYFMSIYGFSIPIVFNYLKDFNLKKFKLIFVLPFLLYIFNALPISMHNYSFLKINSIAFNDIMIKTNKIYKNHFYNNKQMTLTLNSLQPGSGIFTYYIYEVFICYYLEDCKDLDLISNMKWDIKNANEFEYIVGNNKNLSIYKNITKPINEIDISILGNFFYLNINSNTYENKKYLIQNYDLKEYYCTSFNFIPDLNLKELARLILNNIRLDNNYFGLTLHKNRIKDPNFCIMTNENL